MELNFDEKDNWCLSGGADGSDLMWGMTAGKAGHTVVHWSFAGHKTEAPASELVVLTQEQLESADPYCRTANKKLQRRFPANWIGTTNLLRRNWFEVCYSDACYGVSTFGLPKGTVIPVGGELAADVQVNGGTAWATQMFIDRHDGEICACYVFDQEACYWFQWQGKWVRIYEPPKPTNIWAGIGARKLLLNGKLAIRVLMDYKTDYHDPKVFARPDFLA